MRAAAIILFSLLCAVLAAAAAPLTNSVNGHVRLAWSYDTNQLSTNLSFNIYGSQHLSLPASQWPLLTNVPGPNLSCDLQLQPAQYFFVATATDFWGETSITSNLVVTPAPPQPINDSLRIQKLP